MKTIREELEKIAAELKKANEQMAIDVKEGAEQSQQGAERVLRATHKLHHLLFLIPERLSLLAKKLTRDERHG